MTGVVTIVVECTGVSVVGPVVVEFIGGRVVWPVVTGVVRTVVECIGVSVV